MFENNQQLADLFRQVEQTNSNIFDIYEALNECAKLYKKLSISKVPGCETIFKAYELYRTHQNTVEKIFDKLANGDFTKLAEQFDIQKLFEQIPEEYKSILGLLLGDASAI